MAVAGWGRGYCCSCHQYMPKHSEPEFFLRTPYGGAQAQRLFGTPSGGGSEWAGTLPPPWGFKVKEKPAKSAMKTTATSARSKAEKHSGFPSGDQERGVLCQTCFSVILPAQLDPTKKHSKSRFIFYIFTPLISLIGFQKGG